MKYLLIVVLFASLLGCEDSVKMGTYSRDLGIVERIHNCDSGKYRYSCRVVTNKVVWDELDVDELPYETLELGDHMFYEFHVYEDKTVRKICVNNMCMYDRQYDEDSEEHKQHLKSIR